jgi:hypothetical protein
MQLAQLRSRFLVADVTMQRQGVYFEAGFAMALGSTGYMVLPDRRYE